MKKSTFFVLMALFTAFGMSQNVLTHNYPCPPQSVISHSFPYHIPHENLSLILNNSPVPSSPHIIKQKLDSVVFLMFDERGKNTFTYNTQGKLLTETDWSWDNETNMLNDAYKRERSYDVYGNLLEEIHLRKDTITQSWNPQWKLEFSYNGEGNKKLVIGYSYDSESEQWTLYDKNDFEYNETQAIVKTTRYLRSNNDWHQFSLTEYTYSSGGLLMEKQFFHWDMDNNAWKNNWKASYYYSENDLAYQIINSYWNPDISEWENNSKQDITYNDDGNIIEILHSNMQKNSGSWINEWKETTEYDEFGNTISQSEYEWDSFIENWTGNWRSEISYDISIDWSNIVWPYEEEDNIILQHKPINVVTYNWDFNTNDWKEDGYSNLYYSEDDFDYIDENNKIEVQVYPNPVDEYFSLSYPDDYQMARISIIDLQGKILLQKEIHHAENINIGSISQGIYLYQLEIEGKIITGKLIKK